MRLRAGSSDIQSMLTFVFFTLLVMAGIGVWFIIERDGLATGTKPSFKAAEPTNEPTEVVCPTCKGKLTVPCSNCQRGGIYVLDANGQCPTCHGSTVSLCDQCKGKGTITIAPQSGVLHVAGKKP
jgi:hypothetical protein